MNSTQRRKGARARVLHTFPVRYTWTDKATGLLKAWPTVCEGTDAQNALNIFKRLHPQVESAEIVT